MNEETSEDHRNIRLWGRGLFRASAQLVRGVLIAGTRAYEYSLSLSSTP